MTRRAFRIQVFSPFRVGTKSPYFAPLADFQERISRVWKLEIIAPKKTVHAPADVEEFFQKRLPALTRPGLTVFLLDERGERPTTKQFADLFSTGHLSATGEIAFCLGGAFGLPREVKQLAGARMLSLSPLTMPHELAFLVWCEQIYRIQQILSGHPYHHEGPAP